jgi:hypothetical protein
VFPIPVAVSCHPSVSFSTAAPAGLAGGLAVARRGRRPLALAGLLVLLALLLVPEHPADQEAICQRHNGEAACRVW